MSVYRRYTWADPIERLKNAGATSDAVRLDTNGVVKFPGGWMHPNSFRAICGDAAYEALLKLPRVQSEYTAEELEKD